MMIIWAMLLPLLTVSQAPQASPQPAAPQPAAVAPAPLPLLRAQYGWGYAGADGQGKGTLSVLIDPASGRTVLELQGLGERLMLLDGDPKAGFHLQIPRRKLDQQAPSLAAIPLPFLPQLATPGALYRLLSQGEGPGVKVTKRDSLGPVKLSYKGVDDQGKEVLVWLQRTRWEPESAK